MVKQIPSNILDILSQMEIEGNVLKRFPAQLPKETYKDLNDVLIALGGKWNRKADGHVFENDPHDMVEEALLTGIYTNRKQDFGMFFTPPELVKSILDAEIGVDGLRGFNVLEPSAGRGAFVEELIARGAYVYATDIDPENRKHLMDLDINLYHEPDFLMIAPKPIMDFVVMNPPFAKQADIVHVDHAMKFLKPGGVLLAIMSSSVTFRTNKKSSDFRQMIAMLDGEFMKIDDSAFHSSGTDVRTVLLRVEV